jgi:hypothetical protein
MDEDLEQVVYKDLKDFPNAKEIKNNISDIWQTISDSVCVRIDDGK